MGSEGVAEVDSGAVSGVTGGPSRDPSVGTVLVTPTEPVFRTEAEPELALSAVFQASLRTEG